jgi:hypothetical protein
MGGSTLRFSSSKVVSISKATGFRGDMIEKVLQVMHLLEVLNSHPYLKGKWALKGGTALNLFILDLPRLSVDIDLNYIGSLDREDMLSDRARIEQAMQAVFSREGFTTKKMPGEHAGGKWRLGYQSVFGQSGNLEVDVNFMFRQPLWEIQYRNAFPLGEYIARNIPVLDLHELAAGKLSALFARGQARDLFDCYQILKLDALELERLRIAFVAYGGMNRKDWRTLSKDEFHFDTAEVAKQLVPTLHLQLRRGQDTAEEYGDFLVQECKKRLSAILPFTRAERKFSRKGAIRRKP